MYRSSILLIFIILISCSKEEDFFSYEKPRFGSFYLTPEANDNVRDTIFGSFINDTAIFIFSPGLDRLNDLKPSFEGDYSYVEVDNVKQISGLHTQDFTNPVKYTLYDDYGKMSSYDVIVKGYNKIPRILIETENFAPISSKKEYLNALIRVDNCPDAGGVFLALGK